MENHFHIAKLIAKKNKGVITSSELAELEKWINEKEEHLAIYQKATDENTLLDKIEVYRLFKSDKVWQSIDDQLFETKTISFFPRKFMRYAAILIPLMIAVGISWYYTNQSAGPELVSIDESVKPGTQKATLVLADGARIDLEDKNVFSELEQGDIKVTNKQNSLLYKSLEKVKPKVAQIFNELITPLGGTYSITLSDATEVILNAGSTLRFPVDFTDSVRRVYLDGEAHFKVSHNGKPFIVACNDMDVGVLGTTFNVSAYNDEPEIKATLVEGKIKVGWNDGDTAESKILKPDDQATLSKDDLSIKIDEVNTSLYTSWIQGKFEFNKDNLEVVMKRLARWYDFEYEFKNNDAKNYHFTARINNDESISSILDMLEMTTDVKFEFKDDILIVL